MEKDTAWHHLLLYRPAALFKQDGFENVKTRENSIRPGWDRAWDLARYRQLSHYFLILQSQTGLSYRPY